jgi:hypothetical protein
MAIHPWIIMDRVDFKEEEEEEAKSPEEEGEVVAQWEGDHPLRLRDRDRFHRLQDGGWITIIISSTDRGEEEDEEEERDACFVEEEGEGINVI